MSIPQPDCAVCECGPDEVPERFLEADRNKTEQLSKVKESDLTAGENFNPWSLPEGDAEREVWAIQDEQSPDLAYVDLLVNPEGYTG